MQKPQDDSFCSGFCFERCAIHCCLLHKEDDRYFFYPKHKYHQISHKNHRPPAAPRASAPGWTEDLKAHFLSRRSAHRTSPPVAQVSADWDESGEDALKLVVRNTFLELQEVGGWERMKGRIHD